MVIVSLGLLAAAAATAYGAGYGKGTFRGTATSGASTAAVTMNVKGRTAKTTVVVHLTRCTRPSSNPATPVASDTVDFKLGPYTAPVKPGPAGGGMMIDKDLTIPTVNGATEVHFSLFAGLRATKVLTNVSVFAERPLADRDLPDFSCSIQKNATLKRG